MPGGGFDQVPAHAVAGGADAVLGELPVVLLGQRVVPRARDEVEPAAIGPALRGALEAADEEGAEQAGLESGTHGPSSGRRRRRA
jgi:hypothetical protein